MKSTETTKPDRKSGGSRGTCCAPLPNATAGCPIQALFWLEWDTTALDAPFLSLEEKPMDLLCLFRFSRRLCRATAGLVLICLQVL
jgi:hypothetical protein